MTKNLWTYSGQLGAHRNSNILQTLEEIASINSCEITYETSEFKKAIVINYKYKGEKENIDLVQKEITNLKFSMSQQHLHHYFKKQTVNSISQEISQNEFNMTVNVSKFSNFMEIAQAVALELNVSTRANSKSEGFFKGKTVSLQVMGNQTELTAYKTLINEFIIEDTAKNTPLKLKR